MSLFLGHQENDRYLITEENYLFFIQVSRILLSDELLKGRKTTIIVEICDIYLFVRSIRTYVMREYKIAWFPIFFFDIAKLTGLIKDSINICSIFVGEKNSGFVSMW